MLLDTTEFLYAEEFGSQLTNRFPAHNYHNTDFKMHLLKAPLITYNMNGHYLQKKKKVSTASYLQQQIRNQ